MTSNGVVTRQFGQPSRMWPNACSVSVGAHVQTVAIAERQSISSLGLAGYSPLETFDAASECRHENVPGTFPARCGCFGDTEVGSLEGMMLQGARIEQMMVRLFSNQLQMSPLEKLSHLQQVVQGEAVSAARVTLSAQQLDRIRYLAMYFKAMRRYCRTEPLSAIELSMITESERMCHEIVRRGYLTLEQCSQLLALQNYPSLTTHIEELQASHAC